MLGSLGIDFTKWLPNATNEGETQVGDAKTIKISGKADVKQVIADLEKITEKASSLNVPGAGGQHPAEAHARAEGRGRGRDQGLTVDGLHRRRGHDPAPADGQRRPPGRGVEDRRGLLLDFTFTKVGQEQTITAPSNPKPFDELLKAVDAAGIANLGLGGAAPGGGERLDRRRTARDAQQRRQVRRVHRAGQRRRGEGA